MAEIVSSVQRVTDIMGEISAASQEQSVGIEQVNITVTQMDETTQQNAALVEEATAAARSMEEQAVQLTEAVAVFKIDVAGARNARPSAVTAPKPNVIHAKAATPIKAPTRLAAAPKPLAAAASMDGANWQEF